MSEEALLVEKKENICTLTINRPERRNALTIEVLFRIGDALKALGDDRDVRVVVLRGAGEQAFSAGIAMGSGSMASVQETAEKGNPIDYAIEIIISYPYPVIAMIYGAAVGAGCDLGYGDGPGCAGHSKVSGVDVLHVFAEGGQEDQRVCVGVLAARGFARKR